MRGDRRWQPRSRLCVHGVGSWSPARWLLHYGEISPRWLRWVIHINAYPTIFMVNKPPHIYIYHWYLCIYLFIYMAKLPSMFNKHDSLGSPISWIPGLLFLAHPGNGETGWLWRVLLDQPPPFPTSTAPESNIGILIGQVWDDTRMIMIIMDIPSASLCSIHNFGPRVNSSFIF